jgi:hypothetical protein
MDNDNTTYAPIDDLATYGERILISVRQHSNGKGYPRVAVLCQHSHRHLFQQIANSQFYSPSDVAITLLNGHSPDCVLGRLKYTQAKYDYVYVIENDFNWHVLTGAQRALLKEAKVFFI